MFELIASMLLTTVITAPDAAHALPRRASMCVPSIEVSPKNGRLWRVYYAAEFGCESSWDYSVLATSTDDGKTWQDVAIADPDGKGPWRAFDPEVWIDPDGNLRWIWTERDNTRNSNRKDGILDVQTDKLMCATFKGAEDEPDSSAFPVVEQIGTGICLGKPIEDSKGRWIVPSSHWCDHKANYQASPTAGFTISTDRGKTWKEIGGYTADIKVASYPEHNVVELKDGSFMTLMRGGGAGNSYSISTDGCLTWSPAKPFEPMNAGVRPCLRRLKSGNLINVKHGAPKRGHFRYDLSAYVSRDDGKTWEGGYCLDIRCPATYPDVAQDKDGNIYITWDYDRQGTKQFMVEKVTEEDILRGGKTTVSPELAAILNKADPAAKVEKEVLDRAFGAVALLQLDNAGKVRVNDRVDKYLTGFESKDGRPTIYRLYPTLKTEEIVKLVELGSGRTFEEYLKAKVYAKIALPEAPSTVGDLMKLMQAIADGGEKLSLDKGHLRYLCTASQPWSPKLYRDTLGFKEYLRGWMGVMAEDCTLLLANIKTGETASLKVAQADDWKYTVPKEFFRLIKLIK